MTDSAIYDPPALFGKRLAPGAAGGRLGEIDRLSPGTRKRVNGNLEPQADLRAGDRGRARPAACAPACLPWQPLPCAARHLDDNVARVRLNGR